MEAFFAWDDDKGNIRVEKSSLWFFFSILQALFYLGFIVYRFIGLFSNPNSSFPQGSWLFFWINIYLWSLVAFANAYLRKGNSVSAFKGIRKLMDDLSKGKVSYFIRDCHFCQKYQSSLFLANNGTKLPKIAFKSNILDICYVSCLLVEVLYILSTTLMFIAIPHHPQYMYSLINNQRALVNRWSWNFWCFLFIEVYSKACSAFSNGGLGINFFPGMIISMFWTKNAR